MYTNVFRTDARERKYFFSVAESSIALSETFVERPETLPWVKRRFPEVKLEGSWDPRCSPEYRVELRASSVVRTVCSEVRDAERVYSSCRCAIVIAHHSNAGCEKG